MRPAPCLVWAPHAFFGPGRLLLLDLPLSIFPKGQGPLGLLPDWPSGALLWPVVTVRPQQLWEQEEARAQIAVLFIREQCFLVSRTLLGCSQKCREGLLGFALCRPNPCAKLKHHIRSRKGPCL